MGKTKLFINFLRNPTSTCETEKLKKNSFTTIHGVGNSTLTIMDVFTKIHGVGN